MTTKPAGPNDWNTEPLPERRTTIAFDRAFVDPDRSWGSRLGH